MNLSKIDKWILTNIYDFPAGQSKYNELYDEDEYMHNEDEYIYIEDKGYFKIIPDNIPLI